MAFLLNLLILSVAPLLSHASSMPLPAGGVAYMSLTGKASGCYQLCNPLGFMPKSHA